VPDSHRFPY